jgi:hypothetical protein
LKVAKLGDSLSDFIRHALRPQHDLQRDADTRRIIASGTLLQRLFYMDQITKKPHII